MVLGREDGITSLKRKNQMSKVIITFLANGVQTLTNDLLKMRSSLKLAVDEASGTKLADLGMKIAEKQAKLAVYMNLDRAPEMLPNDTKRYHNVITHLLTNLNLDDEWSGRGNDVRRAVFAAQLEAIKECRAVIYDN